MGDGADDAFGPHLPGVFDFTVVFEQTILSLLPTCLFVVLAPFRVSALLRHGDRVRPGPHLWAKLVSCRARASARSTLGCVCLTRFAGGCCGVPCSPGSPRGAVVALPRAPDADVPRRGRRRHPRGRRHRRDVLRRAPQVHQAGRPAQRLPPALGRARHRPGADVLAPAGPARRRGRRVHGVARRQGPAARARGGAQEAPRRRRRQGRGAGDGRGRGQQGRLLVAQLAALYGREGAPRRRRHRHHSAQV